MKNAVRIASLAAFLAAPLAVLPSVACGDGAPAANPPLGGPAVPPDAGKTGEQFGERAKGAAARGGMAAERRDMELWRRAFQELAPELSPEVQEQVRGIRADFEARMKAWREQNAEMLKQFESMRAKDGEKAKPDPETLKKMQAAKEAAPKPEEVQQRIWALLSPEQQASFKERYDSLKKVAMDRKSDRQARKPGDGTMGDPMKPDPTKPDPMLPGGEAPAKKPSDRPFNFEEKDDPARKGDGKPSGK